MFCKRRVLMVGACYVDTILTVDHYPEEDEKLRASSLSKRRGGNCANSLEVFQQLIGSRDNLELALLSVLPSVSSAATAFITRSLDPIVDLDPCLYREHFDEPASSYIFRSSQTSSRTLVNYNNLPEMTTDEFTSSFAAIPAMKTWCHFEGRIPGVTLECMNWLRPNRAVKISVEIEKPGREGLQELANIADVVFYSKSWAVGQGFDDPEKFLLDQSSRVSRACLLCCTWGADGASVLQTSSRSYFSVPAYKVEGAKVVDTVGAGDTFIAGMLYAVNCHSEDWDLAKKLRFANKLAGIKVLQDGFTDFGALALWMDE